MTKVSHATENEGKHIIFDTEKSFRVAPIDCSATIFDSSHDGESSAHLSASAAEEVGSGDDGGVSGFACTYGERLSSSGNVTFYTHSSHVSRLSVAPYSRSVLNNVCYRTDPHLWLGVHAQAPVRGASRAHYTLVRGPPRTASPVSHQRPLRRGFRQPSVRHSCPLATRTGQACRCGASGARERARRGHRT